ncbi:hypothetical protein BH10ACT6_BH10ACT6_05470 [soil metagenome]
MAGRREKPDARLNVARYLVERLSPESPADDEEPDTALSGQQSMDARAQYVEISLQQAMRRGDFDHLPGAGKPLAGLTEVNDPDWWIRRKIEREKLRGLGPPALTLRTEDAELDARLDAAASESTVRELLDDFNRRVIEARRQLLGGPPVVTKTRDVETEITKWTARRTARLRAAAIERERDAAELAASSRRHRRARRPER